MTWHEEDNKPTQYVNDAGKKLYGDFINVESKEKPKGKELAEHILVITQQMLQTVETLKADINNCPLTFVIKESFDQPGVWTIGWKVFLEDRR